MARIELDNCDCQYWEACERVASWQSHVPSHFVAMKNASPFFR